MPTTPSAGPSSVPTPTADAADASVGLPSEVIAEISELFASAVRDHRTAGITWAIVGGHDAPQDVLAAGAAGSRELHEGSPANGSAPMDTATISRIASMTKSFTAASVLCLRDEGALQLDAPVADLVPEAAAITPASADSPVITVRDLLTMSAGFVTDNPWGDRQESMTREAFAALLRGGLGAVHVPGTGFEYSNTGYALLGRIVDEVSGTPYDEYIARTFLQPLGMTDSGFRLEDVDRERVATGHRIADRTDATRFEPVPFDAPGVYGAMAGLYSTTADIARWVRFLAAADAVDAADRPQEPLSTASRRQMQQLHRLQLTPQLPAGPDGVSPGFDRVRGYGFGLVVERFPDLEEVISHSGGYPGYGSFMCWHRAGGVGIVALANAKYAPASTLSMQALQVLHNRTSLLSPRAVIAAPRTTEVAGHALDWLRAVAGGASAEADRIADRWFADNMDLDVSREERTRRLQDALSAAGLGAAAVDALSPTTATVISPAQLRWVLEGIVPGGSTVQIDLLIDPRREALLQGLDVTSVRGR